MKYTLIAVIISLIYWFIFRPVYSHYYGSYKNYKERMKGRCSVYYRKENYYNGRYLTGAELPTLPLEKFKGFYGVSPDSWELENGIAYKYEDREIVSGIVFRPFSNYLKFEKFRKEIKEARLKENENAKELATSKIQDEFLTKALESVQKDIDAVREEAFRKYEEAVDIALGATERIMKERNE